MNMKFLLLLFAIVHLALTTGLGQEGPKIVKAIPSACEQNSAYFSLLGDILAKDPTAKIVARFYAGKTESDATSERRAKYVREYLQQSRRIDIELVNAGKLDTVENPKIEFYVVRPNEPEKLYLVSYAQVNKTPCVDCCPGVLQYVGPKAKRKMTKK